MEFFHKRALLFLRLSFGIFFLWFGVLLLFNVNAVGRAIVVNSNPVYHSQIIVILLSIIEILIGFSYLSNKFVKISTIFMIVHEILGSLFIILTQGFDPRFPVLSILGLFVLKDLILISAGLVILAEKNEIKDKENPIKTKVN